MYMKDPKGLHLTICFKNAEQLTNNTHIASHGYVTDRSKTFIHEATHTPEKEDQTKKDNGLDVWPSGLPCVAEVAYGQVPKPEEVLSAALKIACVARETRKYPTLDSLGGQQMEF
ncbi:conserved hypothetical protein [Histoplasma capsulatum var. duboisii H88]|uniref:Uncharacterized protein n=1 Tax=Ajellomyces capsulatus (strain H88) TaxID=544711 RepID=F0UDY7_AJEC8|nr:conserved hypothetical protein [Histoplasma capsulatum var. duboisii H88]